MVCYCVYLSRRVTGTHRFGMCIFRLVGLLLLAVLVPSANGHAPEPCVTTFHEFEKAAINDSPGNVEALVTAFYETNKPAPLSVHVVYHINSSNGTDTIISADPNCRPGKEMWFWLPSPVFMFVEPTKLNLCALYTLNYFSHWKPRRAHLYVPSICNISHNRFNFLNDLTSRVQIYAAAHLNDKDVNPGYVLSGCGNNTLTTVLTTTMPNNRQGLEKLSEVMVRIYVVGNLFLIIVVVLVICFLLQRCGATIANDNDDRPSLDNYGLFWGCVVQSVIGNGLLTAHAIGIVQLYVSSGAHGLIVLGWLILALLLIGVIASLIVAIHFGRKLPISIPLCFTWPLVILCCDRETIMKVVRCLSLWSLILFLLHISARVGIVALALLALPATVLCTLLIYIIAVVCTVQFLAIIFTFFKMEKSNPSRCSYAINLCQAVAFTFLFATVLCFGLPITAIGALADYGNVWSSVYSVFSIFVAYMAPAAFVWALRRIGSQWLQMHMPEASDPPL